MKTRIDNIEYRLGISEAKLDQHLEEYKKRGDLHEKHNQMQAEFASEINYLNGEIRKQAMMLGEHGVTLGNHNKLFEDMREVWKSIADDMTSLQKYVTIAEARLSFKRQLIDNLFKSLPLILFGLGILWKMN
jgi:hypothetical protein